jgi:hypothetical protein
MHHDFHLWDGSIFEILKFPQFMMTNVIEAGTNMVEVGENVRDWSRQCQFTGREKRQGGSFHCFSDNRRIVNVATRLVKVCRK